MILSLLLVFFFHSGASSLLLFNISEVSPLDSLIGYISSPSTSTSLSYLVVYPDNSTQQTIQVNERNGEIRVKGPLDYETIKRYDVLAVPLNGGEGITIAINVIDYNDCSPTFNRDSITLQVSELARKGALFALPTAEDADSPPFDIQTYSILRGNVNNVFRLQTKRIEGILVPNLEVNGKLDREYRELYELIVEAKDGGDPPRAALLTVRIVLLDANDNPPRFSEGNYTVRTTTNVSLQQPILTVTATDLDEGNNAHITYRLANVRAEVDALFSMSPNGSLFPNSILEAGHYDLVVMAIDGGTPPLQSTSFINVIVEQMDNINSHLDIVWLAGDGESSLLESTPIGSIVARVGVQPPDPRVHLQMSGSSALCMRETDQLHVYLLSVCSPLDRESSPQYNVLFSLHREEHILLEHPILLQIQDVNDNAPLWPSSSVTIQLNGSSEEGVNLAATDADIGDNGRISYSIEGSQAVDITSSGQVRLQENTCGVLSNNISFAVVARDHGVPPLTSRLLVTARVTNQTNSLRCLLPLYETTVREDVTQGTCIIQISTWREDNCQHIQNIAYSLKGDNLQFTTDTQGHICVQSPVDYETRRDHQLTVELYEEGWKTPSDTCTVIIHVEDVNDNAPSFSPLVYKKTMKEEEVMEGMVILVLNAQDEDEGELGKVQYKLTRPNDNFVLNYTSGELSMKGKLRVGEYKMEAVAVDGGDKESIDTASIHIRILPTSSPIAAHFSSQIIHISTSEDVLPGIEIGRVQADSINSNVHYSFYSGDPMHYLAIDGTSGRITVSKYLDADRQDLILVNVQASSPDGDTVYVQVAVHLLDHNDHSPLFGSETVMIGVREDHPIDKSVYLISAIDKDKGKNGHISYSILSSVPPGPFHIHPLLGQLRISHTLDYEKTSFYRVQVKAVDGGVPPRSANMTILIDVIDVNDHSPVIEKKVEKVEIVEGCPIMTLVTRINASDQDSGMGGKLHYSLSGMDSYAFSIDHKSGEVFTRKEFDREEKKSYNLTVTVSDKGKPQLSTQSLLFIRVLDINDNSPSCSSIQPITVSVSTDVTTPIGTIVAKDSDEGVNGTLTYRMEQPNALFLVRPNGEVFVRRSVREEGKRLTFNVVVSDGGTPSRSTICQVSVLVSRGQSSVSIEGEVFKDVFLAHCPLYPCSLIHINATGVAHWRLQSSDVSSSLSISDDGLLSQVGPSSIRSIRPLHVVLEDSNGRQKTLTLSIHPFNHHTPNERAIRIPTSLPIGSPIGIEENEDKEQDYAVFYQLLNKTKLFEVDKARGLLYTIASLADLAGTSYNLILRRTRVEDMRVDDEVLIVQVEGDLPIRPRFSHSLYRINVPENVEEGKVVHKVLANSNEPGALILYSISDRSGLFLCDPSSGEITVQQSLGSFTGKDLLVDAIAEIDGIETTSSIVFTVDDINDHIPRFESSPIVFIHERGKSLLHHVVATDEDIGVNALISYSIIQDDSHHFSIHSSTGALSSSTRLTSDEWLIVRATDGGTPPLHSDQSIHIVAQNDKWKFFHHSTHSIKTLSSNPRHILFPLPHIQDNVKITILPDNLPFKVNDGKVLISRNLTEKEYDMTIVAERDNGDVDWMRVHVNVGEEEYNPPQISSLSCHNVLISENHKYSNLKKIVAVSLGVNATFYIKDGDNSGLFSINNQTGEISCSELDREVKGEYLLVVGLRDSLNEDTCTVRVKVEDQNDNEPMLTSASREIMLKDEREEGTVAILKGKDEDEGDNGLFSFQLLHDPSHILDMNSDGRIVVARNIEYEENEWRIKVRLFDHGHSIQKESTWEILVKDERTKVEKENTIPSFIHQEYTVALEEGQSKGVQLMTLDTTERDAPLTYSIVQGNVDHAFDIDAHGSIITSQELDREIRKEYKLKVMATSNSFTQVMETTVIVIVLNVNDNAPTVQNPSRRKISEATPIGTFITSITATDVDEDSILQYSIDPPSNQFSIDPFTGIIHTTRQLDYEIKKEVDIAIVVSDGVHLVTTRLSITILDENDNRPTFASSFYDVVLPNSLSSNAIIGQITATDVDSEEKTRIEYSLVSSHPVPFRIDQLSGHLLSISASSIGSRSVIFAVIATDNGSPPLESSTVVRISAINRLQHSTITTQPMHRLTIKENSPEWTVVGNISQSSSPLSYTIMDTSAASQFTISDYGIIYTKGRIDRETTPSFQFRVSIGEEWTSSQNITTTVNIRVLDENDNAPVFGERDHVLISEDMQKGNIIHRMSAVDGDEGENGTVTYRIISGNDYHVLQLDSSTGALKYNEWSDMQLLESSSFSWEITVVAEDGGNPSLFTIHTLTIQVKTSTWTHSAPFFPIPVYHVFIPENSAPGTMILDSHPSTRVGVPLDGPSFSLHDGDSTLFSVDSHTGHVTLLGQMDYESRSEYSFSLSVTDIHSRSAIVSVLIHILAIDEFAPTFTSSSYTFKIGRYAEKGDRLGRVEAKDNDKGKDGRVTYRLSSIPHSIIRVNEENGEVTLAESPNDFNHSLHQMTVVASSGPLQQSSALIFIEIGDTMDLVSSPIHISTVLLLLILFLVLLVLLLVCICGARYKYTKDMIDQSRKQVYSIKSDAKSSQMVNIHRNSPPLVPCHMHSRLMHPSVRECSRYSIRDIQSTRSQPDSGIEPDTCSMNSSVTEYLTSLGVSPFLNIPPPISDEDERVNELLYGRVDEIPIGLLATNNQYIENILPSSHTRRGSIATFQPLASILLQEEEERKNGRQFVQISV